MTEPKQEIQTRMAKQMKATTKATYVGVLVALGMTLMPAASRAEEQHPRLLATPEALAAIRAEIRKPGSHHQQAYEVMKARVDLSMQDMAKAYRGGGEDEAAAPVALKPEDYAWGYRARESACLAMLAMTREEQAKYAELAYKAAMETARRSQS